MIFAKSIHQSPEYIKFTFQLTDLTAMYTNLLRYEIIWRIHIEHANNLSGSKTDQILE